MAATTMITELEAVNMMLAGSQRPQVAAISPAPNGDVTNAVFLLEQKVRTVQAEGWYFNTEYDVQIAPTADEIILPTDAIRVDLDPNGMAELGTAEINPTTNVCRRDTRLYNLDDHDYEFTESVSLMVVYQLTWDELPPTVRHYIALAAAVDLQNVILGDKQQDALLRAAMGNARALLQVEEASVADWNSQQNNAVLRVTSRGAFRG